MRPLLVFTAAIVSLVGLSACAGSAADNPYVTDLERLEAQCEERGGYLTPTGQATGRVETENFCVIRGQASRPGG